MANYKLKYAGEKIDELLTKIDNLGTGTDAKSGTVKLSSATDSDSGVSDGVAATPAAVKAAVDGVNAEIEAVKTDIVGVKTSVTNVTNSVSAVDYRVGVLEKQVSNMNIDNADLRNIAYDIAKGTASAKYPVGTKLIIPWERTPVTGDKTNYDVEWNIVHHEENVAYKNSADDETEKIGNAMYLEWDKTIPDSFPFCIQQALQCFDGTDGTPNGLPAGTYAIKMKAPNGGTDFRSYWNGKYATIVLTKAIPAGGTMRLTISTLNGTDTSQFGLIFKTYNGFAQSDSEIETYIASTPSDTLPDGATYLGEVWGEDVGFGKLNHPEACYYGSNIWAYSDLRQWLNGDGSDWWKKLSRYNIKPNIASQLQGFLTGLDSGIKSMLKFVKVVTIGNNQQYAGQQFITYDKVFLHSNNQENITTDYSSQFDNEGNCWDYYKQLAQGVSNLDSLGRFKIWKTYPILIRYAINAPTSAQYVFGRSAYLSGANSVFYVNTYGDCRDAYANGGPKCLPACVIIGSE